MPENCKGVGMYHFSEIINKFPWSSLSWNTDSSATPQKSLLLCNPCKKLIIVFKIDLHWFFSEPVQSSSYTYTYDLSYFQVKVYHTLSNLPAFRPHLSSPHPCSISRPPHFPLFYYLNNMTQNINLRRCPLLYYYYYYNYIRIRYCIIIITIILGSVIVLLLY